MICSPTYGHPRWLPELKKGEMFIVPKGKEHKPIANSECQIMLIEPKGVVNTGNTVGERTAENNIWI